MNIHDKNSIVEALRAGRVKSISVSGKSMGDKRVRSLLALAEECGVTVNLVNVPSKRRRHGKSSDRQADIEAFCEPYKYASLEELREKVDAAGKRALVIALDHIQDPRNLGAVIRTAAAVGACGVVIESRRCCEVTDTVYETSCGGADRIPVARVTNLRQTLQEMKKWGCWIAGADERAKDDCRSADLTSPLVLALGCEGEGLSRIVSQECDFLVKVPTVPEFPSLNVSVAAAILMFEAMSQKNS